MEKQSFKLWENTPGKCEEIPQITWYQPQNKILDCAVVIFAGGAYGSRAEYEGKDYGEFLAQTGITAFVVDYRVSPHRFPLPLLDARRAVRYIRHNAEKFAIDKNKVYVMGSSAGGHLASLISTYFEPIDFEGIDEIDNEDFIPNGQILCYPVTTLCDYNIASIGTGNNLIGDKYQSYNPEQYLSRKKLSVEYNVSEKTPKAFIWHTFADGGVDVRNSLLYATALREYGVPVEMHLYPDGEHGIGLATKPTKEQMHAHQWTDALITWLKYIN